MEEEVEGKETSGSREVPADRRTALLLFSAFVVSTCAITYELLIGAAGAYLLGNSVLQFSLTIGVFLAAMGLGAFLSQWIEHRLLERFVDVELVLSAVGGASGWLLFAAFIHTRSYYAVMFSIILVIGTLIGLELPLLTRYLRRFGSLRRGLARVFALDYLGALVASVAFPLVLLPLLGLFRTALAVGVLNGAVAMTTAIGYRSELTLRPRLVVGALIVAGQVTALALAEPIVSDIEQKLYEDPIIYSEQSDYQKLVLTRHEDDVRLYLDGGLQFSTRDEYRYHEALIHPAMVAAAERQRVLVIGGGDGLGIREVLHHDGLERVVLVDLDPAVTRLARAHPALRAANRGSLDDPRVEVVNADGFSWLRDATERFDVIIVDLPDPSREALTKLYSVTFYRMAEKHLRPGGALVTQATSPLYTRDAFWCIVGTGQAAGFRTTPYHVFVPSFGDWGFVMMTRAPVDFAHLVIPQSTRFLRPATLPALVRFGADASSVPTDPNTLDRPTLIRYYERSVARWN